MATPLPTPKPNASMLMATYTARRAPFGHV